MLDYLYNGAAPNIHWENHEPIKFWYDADKDMMCSDCGVDIPFIYDMSTPFKAVDDCIYDLHTAILDYFNNVLNIPLISFDD